MSDFNPEGIVWASLKPLRGNLFAQNLTKKTYRIGRDENKNEVCLSDLAIQLEHCEISQKQDATCWLKNLSDNEICVDEKILQKDEETELRSGDTIKLAGDSNGQDNILSYVFSKPEPPNPLKRPYDIELEIPFEKSVKPPLQDLTTEDWNYESLKSTFESFWSEMPKDMGFDEEDNSERFSKEYQSKWTQFKTIPTMIEPMASKFDILSSVVAKVYQRIVSPNNKEQNLSKLRTLKHILWQNFFGLLDQIEGRSDDLSLYIRGELLRSEFIDYSPDKFDIYEDLYHQFIKNPQEIKALKDFENTSKITKGAYTLINDIFNHPEAGLSLVNAFRKLKLFGPNPLCEMGDSQAISEIKKLLPSQIIQYIENNYLLRLIVITKSL